MPVNPQKKKFNIYNIFNPYRDGKGVLKEPDAPRDFKFFFKLLSRNFGRMMSVNMFIILGNFPFLFIMLGASGNLNYHSSAPASSLFAPLNGALLNNPEAMKSPVTMALMGVHGVQHSISVNSPSTMVCYGLGALVIFTFGLVSVGVTYILRNIVKGEPIFMWDDFWYAIKRNYKQGLILGIIDVALSVIVAYDIFFFYFNIGSFLNNVMFYMSLVIAFVYIVMRFYMYIMLITFDLSLRKIFKNALIFSIIGFKRNIMAVLGLIVIAFVNYSILLMFIPLGVILPFLITLGLGTFVTTYAAFPKIKEIMIDPYYKEENKADKEEPIFKDMG